MAVGMAQEKSIEMSEVSIRRLRHGTNKRGEPATLKHPITGVKCLYLQCPETSLRPVITILLHSLSPSLTL